MDEAVERVIEAVRDLANDRASWTDAREPCPLGEGEVALGWCGCSNRAVCDAVAALIAVRGG